MGDGGGDDVPTGLAPTELGGAIDGTEAQAAWSLDDGADLEWSHDDGADSGPSRRLTPGRITAISVAASALVIASAGTVVALRLHDDPQTSASPSATSAATPAISTSSTATPSPSVSAPLRPTLQGADAQFIAELQSYGVPVSDEDPQFDINTANAMCALVHDEPRKYPPGTSTTVAFVSGVMAGNPSWSRQQASRFVDAAASHYCPEMSGPSEDEIAAMAPDTRFLAILQSRYGITPVGGGESAIRAAPSICAWKSEGWTDDQVMNSIDSNNTVDVERAIVETAVRVYCPEYS